MRTAEHKRSFSVRRAGVLCLAVAWLVGGAIGTYSYAENYNLHRGFATPARLPRAKPGRLFNVHFRSVSLGRRTDYMVYLPAAWYASRPSLPVFYLLHGSPGRPVAYTVIAHIEVRLDNLISQGLVPPMILVFPDGRIGGSTFSDSEWANTRAGRYDSYVVDVVRDVDRRFGAERSRWARVIGGFSAGAYGAINVALHHLRVFSAVEVWSGYFRQTPTGVFAHATPQQLFDNSPIDYVPRLRSRLQRYPLRVYMYVGRRDRSSRQIVPMARELRAAGARVAYAIDPGGHDWELWNAHLAQMLILAGRWTAGPPAHAVRPARARRVRRRHPHRRGRHRHRGFHRPTRA
jgi:enterochelin esterase-like enzyme